MGCLLFNSNATLTWEEANTYCQKEEGSLLQIWNELQLDFVRMQLSFLYDHVPMQRWWTAGTDAGKEGEWRWTTSLAPVADFIWQTDQPSGGLSENCLYLYYQIGFMGGDYPCTSNIPAAICERK